MSTQYAARVQMDLGERIHLKSVVKPKCEKELPFVIRTAKYELWDSQGILEDSGECTINGHEIDAVIQPQKDTTYKFKYIYEVADEIWIDVIRLVVS